jgi:hypothetical protein
MIPLLLRREKTDLNEAGLLWNEADLTARLKDVGITTTPADIIRPYVDYELARSLSNYEVFWRLIGWLVTVTRRSAKTVCTVLIAALILSILAAHLYLWLSGSMTIGDRNQPSASAVLLISFAGPLTGLGWYLNRWWFPAMRSFMSEPPSKMMNVNATLKRWIKTGDDLSAGLRYRRQKPSDR